MKYVISLFDLDSNELEEIFLCAADLKERTESGIRDPLLNQRVIALIFEKPSLRTRVSFETAMIHLGGSSLFLMAEEVGLGHRESVPDFARVLGSYVDGVVLRTFSHALQVEFARHSQVPVINGLSDYAHPCQAMTDLFTLTERWSSIEGRTLVFVGDGNNVARSLAIGCGKLGMRFVLAAPKQYQFEESFQQELRECVPQLLWSQQADPMDAVKGADVIYADVWTSMGQEEEADTRREALHPFQVNQQLMERASPDACFMHCLPAHRGEEVTAEVIDGPQSMVFQQAANRLHLQKALLVTLLNKEEKSE